MEDSPSSITGWGWGADLQEQLWGSRQRASWAWASPVPQQWRWLKPSLAVLTRWQSVGCGKVTCSFTGHMLDCTYNTVLPTPPDTRKASVKGNEFSGGPPGWSGAIALVQWGEAEGNGLVQPGEEMASGAAEGFPLLTRKISRRWSQAVHSGAWWKDDREGT